MSRYIDADKLKAYKFHPLPYTHNGPTDVGIKSHIRGWNDALDAAMTKTPTADVRENVHGEWIYKKHRLGKDEEIGWFQCSACGRASWIKEGNFCPNCGADMRW